MKNKVSVIVLICSCTFIHKSILKAQITEDKSPYRINFQNLPDSIIKNEIANFSIKAKQIGYKKKGFKLKEVSIKNCKNGSIGFYSFLGGVGLFIDINDKSKEVNVEVPDTSNTDRIKNVNQINSIVFENGKGDSHIPKIAFEGLYNFTLCNTSYHYHNNFRVFKSYDAKRVYIYMIGGKTNEKFEATIVMNNNGYYRSYYKTVVDKIVSEE
jgi:hypothetical protein